MRCEVFKARAHRAGLSTARLARPESAAENARARDSVRERTVREPHVTLAWSARAAVSTCACPASTSKTSEFDVCENSMFADTGKGRTGSKTHPGPRKPQIHSESAFAFDIIYPMQIFIGSRGNLHRRLKVMGTFTAARSKRPSRICLSRFLSDFARVAPRDWGRRLSAPLRASASHAGGAHLHPEPATESCSSVAPRSKQHRARHVTCHHAVGEARQADQGVEARRGEGCEEGAQGEGGDGVAVHHAQCRAEQASAQARGFP